MSGGAGTGPILISGGAGFIGMGRDGEDVAEHVRTLNRERAQAIGRAALARVLAEHTHAHRGAQVDTLLRRRVQQQRSAA